MTISNHAEMFAGLPVKIYESGKGLGAAGKNAWVLTLGEEAYEPPAPLTDLLAAFLKEKGVEQVAALVIGAWEEVGTGTTSESIVEALVAAKSKLPALKAIFLGDIVVEESEISWINQSDMSPLLSAYPKLEEFRVRGGTGLSLGTLKHGSLRSLIVETGGLSSEVVRQVAAADLPALEHLELWLGSDNYGADWTIKDLQPILDGARFPKLQVLGLRDSEKTDELAAALAAAPVVGKIRVLDLSLGTLGDQGAEALLGSPGVKKLKRLDLHHHYVSKDVSKKFKGLGIEVDLRDPQEADKDDGEENRYCAVSE